MLYRSSGSHIFVRVPAKLNLFLEVLGKRPDGFHELETLMMTVGVEDALSLTLGDDGGISLECGWAEGWRIWDKCRGQWRLSRPAGPFSQPPLGQESAGASSEPAAEEPVFLPLPDSGDNLVVRALRLLQAIAVAENPDSLARLGAAAKLIKSIPAAAGLGGASADAAAALLAGNRLWRLNWPTERLAEVAARLGSDIPFFVGQDGPAARAAICRGRGERIEWLQEMPRWPVVVVRPPVGLATAPVFRACRPATEPRSVGPLLEALRRGDARRIRTSLWNRLEEPAATLTPWIGRLRRWFDRWDLIGHQMSGSGSSYFGLCWSNRQARRVASLARQAGLGVAFATVTPSV